MPPSEHSGSQNAHKGSNETPRRARQRSMDPATHWQAGPSEAGEQNSEVADAVIRAAARRRPGTGFAQVASERNWPKLCEVLLWVAGSSRPRARGVLSGCWPA
jgi:hypothetical protein